MHDWKVETKHRPIRHGVIVTFGDGLLYEVKFKKAGPILQGPALACLGMPATR